MGAGGNGTNQWEWGENGNKARLNLGLGMGMNNREWEGMGLKKTFPLTSSCYLLLRAGITRCAVLCGSLCLCIVSVVEHCDLTDIKGKIYFFIFFIMARRHTDASGKRIIVVVTVAADACWRARAGRIDAVSSRNITADVTWQSTTRVTNSVCRSSPLDSKLASN